jgi:hypothetical protein
VQQLFIRTASLLGLASQLKTFPDNEIRRGQFTMKLKARRKMRSPSPTLTRAVLQRFLGV